MTTRPDRMTVDVLSGKMVKQVAADYGVSPAAVSMACKRRGVSALAVRQASREKRQAAVFELLRT